MAHTKPLAFVCTLCLLAQVYGVRQQPRDVNPGVQATGSRELLADRQRADAIRSAEQAAGSNVIASSVNNMMGSTSNNMMGSTSNNMMGSTSNNMMGGDANNMMGGMMGGSGGGMMGGSGGGMMGGSSGGMDMGMSAHEMGVVHSLLASAAQIRREYNKTSNGISSHTYSTNPQLAALIQEHVAQMRAKVLACQANPAACSVPRKWDPLFAAVFKDVGSISMQVTNCSNGVRVVETGNTARSAELVQAHAAVVSAFVRGGFNEAMKLHSVPGRK